jgi:hypothetical protein
MSFLDLYQGDQEQAAKIQPNEGARLPSGFDENLRAAWSDGQLFSQSIARSNARAAVLGDYVDEIRQKTGNDLSKEFIPDVAGGGQTGVTDFTQANERVAKLKQDYPDLDLNPLSEDEIDKRAVAKSQAAHRTYQQLQAGEKTLSGSVGSFLGSAGSAGVDPINILALAIAPETGGASILGAALRWGGLAAVSQAAIEASSDSFKEQVQPGYTESGEPIKEIGGAFVSGAVLGGGLKALGNAWTRVKTGAWPTSVRDAGNVIESEANVASTNPFLPKPLMSDAEIAAAVSGQPTPEAQAAMAARLRIDRESAARQQQSDITAGMSMQPSFGVQAEVAHREALVKAIDDILAGRPVDVSAQIPPELVDTANEAARARAAAAARPGMPTEQLPLDFEAPAAPKVKAPEGSQPITQTPDQMRETLAAPDHQDAIRADIDRARAMGDVQVPGVDENGNHVMMSVDKAVEEVDKYKQVAEQIQACANPVQEAAE